MKRLILSLAPLTLAAGCATVPAQTGTTAFSEAIPHDITAGQARLAVQLYPKLAEAAEPNDNLFISPLSLSEGLGLALPGARGQTEAEMRDLLGWDAGFTGLGCGKPARTAGEGLRPFSDKHRG